MKRGWLFAVVGIPSVALALSATAPSRPTANRQPPTVEEENVPYNGRFVFARLRYSTGLGGWGGGRRSRGGYGGCPSGGPGWQHDYPCAERNLMAIIRNLTALEPGSESGNVVDIGDPELFKYPIAYMSEPGEWDMDDEEVANLRAYVLKGGFLIFDDFPGGGRGDAWPNFSEQMKRILPELQPVVVDATQPVFHSFFDIESLENVFQSYRGSPVFIAYFEENDPTRRMVVIANYQNDLGENWEYESRGFSMIPEAANEAFKFGINYIFYALTH
jgi:hypothetical protein